MTRELNFDPSREPLPPDDELWGGPLPDTDAFTPDTRSDDEAIDTRLRTLAGAAYNTPAMTSVPRDAMWAAIAARRATATPMARLSRNEHTSSPVIVHRITPRTRQRLWPMFAALAATLVMGVAIGRTVDRSLLTSTVTNVADANGAPVGGGRSTDVASALPLMLAQLTAEHLGRSEALLVSAKQDPAALEADAMLQGWARDLLSTTRLLLDTDQLTDPRMRQLLQDLELTLALILQAQASGRAVDAQAVRDDLDNGDLLLRVRSASMPTMLSTDDVRGMSE